MIANMSALPQRIVVSTERLTGTPARRNDSDRRDARSRRAAPCTGLSSPVSWWLLGKELEIFRRIVCRVDQHDIGPEQPKFRQRLHSLALLTLCSELVPHASGWEDDVLRDTPPDATLPLADVARVQKHGSPTPRTRC